MPKRDFRYYINTIMLKSMATTYDLCDRLSFWEGVKNKNKERFTKRYNESFGFRNLNLNHSFSKEYTTYRFFSNATDLEQQIRFNTEGVALCLLDAQKIHENPLLPAYFALVCYNDFLLNQNEESLTKFWTQTTYLDAIGVQKNNCLLFMYEEDEPVFGVKSPWFSGVTQGMIASVFVRAFDLTKDIVHREKARQTLEALFIPLEEGGVFCQTPDGFDWIEEYPSVSRRSMVLCGFIFCMVGMYEYLILCKDDDILKKRLSALVESLFKTLHHYIRGKFVKYSRFSKSFQNINYQGLIVFQFFHLFELSGNEAFYTLFKMLEKEMNWAAYFRFHQLTPPQYFKDLFHKNKR
jgi:hypothetical protein